MLPVIPTIRRPLLPLLVVTLLVGCGANSSAPHSSTAPTESQPATEMSQTTAAPAPEPTASESITVANAAASLTPAALWERLAQPGDTLYVVLLRHAIAPGTGDPVNFQLNDCSTQRNLSEEGRSQAAQIGQAFRDRGVEVQQVLSSQWCRCLETAEQMNLGPVEAYPALNSFFRDRSTAAAQTAEVKQYLLAQAANPGVTVMVTHQVNITGLTDVVPQSGEAVVLQVEETGLTQIGQFLPASAE